MTAFELYALFGAPLLLVVVAVAVVWLTRLEDRHEKRHHAAAE
ncbi:MAG: hypothetical protein Q7S17_10935 [Xanthobacteraceae bacterium]|nr:hypothetical protein [Xanthobacteraceae bacterium]